VIDPKQARDAIYEAFGHVEDFDDFVLAAAQHIAVKRDPPLADAVKNSRQWVEEFTGE